MLAFQRAPRAELPIGSSDLVRTMDFITVVDEFVMKLQVLTTVSRYNVSHCYRVFKAVLC